MDDLGAGFQQSSYNLLYFLQKKIEYRPPGGRRQGYTRGFIPSLDRIVPLLL